MGDIWTVEKLRNFKGQEKLTDKQLVKLADLLNLLPGEVDAKTVEDLITAV